MYQYKRFALLYSRNQHIVNQLYFNKNSKVKKMNKNLYKFSYLSSEIKKEFKRSPCG